MIVGEIDINGDNIVANVCKCKYTNELKTCLVSRSNILSRVMIYLLLKSSKKRKFRLCKNLRML